MPRSIIILKKKGGAKWSRTNKCWYIPCVEEKYEKLCKALHGKAIIQTEELKAYLKERKKNSAAKNMHLPLTAIPVVKPSSQKIAPQNLKQPHTINKENKEALQMFTQQLVLKSYSPSTIKTYRNEFIQFLQAIRNTPANKLSVQRIKDYLQYCFVTLKQT